MATESFLCRNAAAGQRENMNMESRIEKAKALHGLGYNCAQAVACTYADVMGLDEETIFRMMEAQGLGMGGMNGICGAVTGAVTVLGYCNSRGPQDTTTKKETYRLASELEAAFQIKNGSLICKELKGVDTKVVLRPCTGCIEDACRFLEAKIRSRL